MPGIVLSTGNRAVNRLFKNLTPCEVHSPVGETNKKGRSKGKSVCQVTDKSCREK